MIDPDALVAQARELLAAFDPDRPAAIRALLAAHPELLRANIHAAALSGDAGAVTARLAAGDSPNAALPVEHEGHLPVPVLYLACVLNHADAAKVLLEAGANPNDGESVYHAAEHDHRDCLALLLAHGADLSSRHPHWDNTPLYFLAGYPPDHHRAASAQRGMSWLLEHGADPTVASYVRQQPDGTPGVAETPLHRVAELGWGSDMATLLGRHGAKVDAVRGDGRTSLALAIRAGNQAMAEALVSLGADEAAVHPVDHLIGAAMRGELDRVAAVRAQHPALEAYLVAPRSAADHQVLLRACQAGHAAGVRTLVGLGWSLTQEGPWGGTPLHWAAWHGRPATTAALVALGAPLDQRDSSYGSSPIAWGAHGSSFGRRHADADYVTVAHLLAQAGAARDAAINRWGETPESMASPAVAAVLRDWAGTTP